MVVGFDPYAFTYLLMYCFHDCVVEIYVDLELIIVEPDEELCASSQAAAA